MSRDTLTTKPHPDRLQAAIDEMAALAEIDRRAAVSGEPADAPRCGTCHWWHLYGEYPGQQGYRPCGLMTRNRVSRGSLAALADGNLSPGGWEGGRGELLTSAGFSCVLHEPRHEGVERVIAKIKRDYSRAVGA